MPTYSLVSQSPKHVVEPSVSPQALALLALGQTFGWEFPVLGKAPMPTVPVRVGEWLIAPAQQDSTHIPTRALERVRVIYEAGLRPQGFVLVHEAPMLLSAPDQPTGNTWQVPTLSPQLKSALLVTAKVLGGLAVLSAILPLGMVMALGMAMAAVDPILIAVTEDNEWIEIDRWV